MLAYGCREPELLSKRQRITRMYMSSLRISNDTYLLETPHDSERFHETIYRLKNDFKQLKELNESDSEFIRISKIWEDFLADNFDVYGLATDNRPYSLNSNKYYIYSDEQMLSDPFGYYRQDRAVFGENKPENSVFASDFPIGDDIWYISDFEVGVNKKRELVERNDV